MSKKGIARVKQKVYIVMAFPSHHDKSDEGRIVAVHARREGAVQRMIRLERADNKHKFSYHIVRKSVQGTEHESMLSSELDISDIVFIHRGN